MLVRVPVRRYNTRVFVMSDSATLITVVHSYALSWVNSVCQLIRDFVYAAEH